MVIECPGPCTICHNVLSYSVLPTPACVQRIFNAVMQHISVDCH